MVNDIFGFQGEPFGITPNPRFVYFDPQRQKAYASLISFLKHGESFVLLTGAHGLGKTVLIRYLAQQLEHMHQIVEIFSCQQVPSVDELRNLFSAQIGSSVQSTECIQSHRDPSHVSKGTFGDDSLGALLLDDADNLDVDTIKAAISWTQTLAVQHFQLSIVLAGSTDCIQRLREAGLGADKQEPCALIQLTPLKMEDVKHYIAHRLAVAGYDGPEIFTPEAVKFIAHGSHGNPQAINRFCRAALVIASNQSSRIVSADMVEQVAPGGLGTREPKEILPASRLPETVFPVDAKGVRPKQGIGQVTIPNDPRASPRPPSDNEISYRGELNYDVSENTKHIISLVSECSEAPSEPFHIEDGSNTAALGLMTQPSQTRNHKHLINKGTKWDGILLHLKTFLWIAAGIILIFGSVLLYLLETGRIDQLTIVTKESTFVTLTKQERELGDVAAPYSPNPTPTGWVEPPLDPSSSPTVPSGSRTSDEVIRRGSHGQYEERNGDRRNRATNAASEKSRKQEKLSAHAGLSTERPSGTNPTRGVEASGEHSDEDLNGPSAAAFNTPSKEYLNAGAPHSEKAGSPRPLEHLGDSEFGNKGITKPSAGKVVIAEPALHTVGDHVSSRAEAIPNYETASGTPKALPSTNFDKLEQSSSLDNSRLINSGETKYSVPLTSGDQKLLLTDSKPTNDTGEVALKEGPVEVETLSGPSRDVTSESRMAYGPQSAESRSALEQQFEQQDASIVQLNTDQLLVRAGQLIELDDVASARLVYQLAALRGSAAAASALGGTYDPVQLSKLRIREIRPDPTQAIRWYRKAIDLGDQSALVKLGELATWLQQEAARETARSK